MYTRILLPFLLLGAIWTLPMQGKKVKKRHYDIDQAFDLFDHDLLAAPTANPSTCDPAVIDGFLISTLNAVCILQQYLYLHTNPLNQRSLLDYGLFIPYQYYAKPHDIQFHFFANVMLRANFTRSSSNIESYLAIFKPTLITELDRVLNNIRDLVDLPFDVHSILPLFRNMTVQERRAGVMIQGIHRFKNNLRLRYLFPIYYTEANLFLTPQEQEAIEEQLGITDPAEDLKFARQHLISDKLGIGDLRINLDMPLTTEGSVISRAGILATIPTAFAFKKGLYGSHFEKTTSRPQLDMCTIFDLAVAGNFTALATLGQQLAFAALNQFSANLIDMPLGNGGHFGLGLYMRSKTKLSTLIKRPWAEYVKMTSWISAEYLFPRQQLRYFVTQTNTPAFAAIGLLRPLEEIEQQITDDPVYAQTVLTFLEKEMIDRIFPYVLSTRVRPGMIFRWVSRYTYNGPHWGYSFGTDAWITSKEKLSHIKAPQALAGNLNLDAARKPFAYQAGTMASVFWKQPHDLLVSLNLEYNFTSVGIGSDALLTIVVEKLF